MAAPWCFLDPFAARQFDPAHKGPRILVPQDEFTATINRLASLPDLVDGYAPFCKHVFVPNFTGAKATCLPITDANRSLLQSGYQARTEKEVG